MSISTLSKHLPAVINYVRTPPGDCLLEVVHLVESARYHLYNLNRITSGKGKAPPGFQAGVDFTGEVLDSHWRIMAAWIEFEAFLTAAKRCLDHLWCCLGEQLGDETTKVRTLGGAIYTLKKRVKDQDVLKFIDQNTYFNILKISWAEWGSELADLRNYVEHQAPLGGRSTGFTQKNDAGEIINIFVPDKIPGNKNIIPKNELSFSNQIKANSYCQQALVSLDNLVEDILNEGINI